MFAPNQAIVISGIQYSFDTHPMSRDFIYEQVGRRAKVYRVSNANRESFALKVFYEPFRTTHILTVSKFLESYAELLGMAVASRIVITSINNRDLVQNNPELEFAILMPWIEGSTCFEIFSFFDKSASKPDKIISNVLQLSEVLYTLENNGLAHTDISSSNVMVSSNSLVNLVGIENFYGERFPMPDLLSTGSPGYAHSSAKYGLWNSVADRFAGAILIVEYLGLLSDKIKQNAYGETFFAQDEIGRKDSLRFGQLCQVLDDIDRHLVELFRQTWFSQTLDECPQLREWHAVIKDLS